jgi:ATP-dependent DNA helicase RecG
LNAIIHKRYESGIPIQISVYDDKLYIANIGQLPEDWTLENLLNKHASRPYNPNIANTFYLAGFIESWGRGIEKIFTACKDDGVPEPSYTVHPGDIMIKFTAPEDRVIKQRNGGDVVDNVVDNVVEVMSLLKETPNITTKQIAAILSIGERQAQRIIKKLKDANRIHRVGSDRSGYWEVIE